MWVTGFMSGGKKACKVLDHQELQVNLKETGDFPVDIL